MFNFNLLKKELIQAKAYIKGCMLAILIILIFIYFRQLTKEGIYFLIIFLPVYVITSSVDDMEGKGKGNYIINSLPVTRKEIVISRYLNSTSFSIVLAVFLKIISHLISSLGIAPLRFETALGIILSIILYISINYLLYFCTNPKASQIIRIITYGAIFGGAFSYFSKEDNKGFDLFRYISNSKLAVLSIILIFIISIFISLKVYENKDL